MCVEKKRKPTRVQAALFLVAACPAILFGFALPTAHAADEERIVSIGGAVTEILYALGYGSHIAAIDTTSLYPPDALKTKPNVGYMRALSVEGVLSVNPSLIVASEGAGPPAALAALQESGVRMVTVPDEKSPAGVRRKILIVGELVGRKDAAQKLADDVETRFVSLEALRTRIERPKSVLFVLSAAGGKTLVGGRGTSADAIITLAGATNAAASIEGFKPMGDEAIINAAPEIVLMMRRENTSAPDILATPAFAATPAGKTHALLEMDGNYLLGFGPRAPEAARDLMAALYPELKWPSLEQRSGSGVDSGQQR